MKFPVNSFKATATLVTHTQPRTLQGFYKPVIADLIEYKLEPGMVLAYEPAVYLPGKEGRCMDRVTHTSNQPKTPSSNKISYEAIRLAKFSANTFNM